MEKKIKLTVNECDVCSKREEVGKKDLFTIWSDVCDECFLSNGASIQNFEIKDGKWIVKLPQTKGENNE